MTLYNDMQKLAGNLLNQFKQGQTYLIMVTPGTGPKDNPGPPTEKRIPYNGTVRGVRFRFVQNGLAAASDLQTTMPYTVDAKGVEVEPNGKCFVEADGVRYKVVEVVRTPAVGTVITWTLILRK